MGCKNFVVASYNLWLSSKPRVCVQKARGLALYSTRNQVQRNLANAAHKGVNLAAPCVRFKVACHLVMSVSRNQPEFSSFTMQLLKMCDPTPFPTLPCGNPTTEPVNHNTHPTQISLHLLLPTIQLLYLFLPTHTEDRFHTFLIFPFSI